MTERAPDADLDTEAAALSDYYDAQDRAARQLEAMGGAAEVGTDAGERYAGLERDSYYAYVHYSDTWLAAHPQATADADTCPGRIIWHEPDPEMPEMEIG